MKTSEFTQYYNTQKDSKLKRILYLRIIREDSQKRNTFYFTSLPNTLVMRFLVSTNTFQYQEMWIFIQVKPFYYIAIYLFYIAIYVFQYSNDNLLYSNLGFLYSNTDLLYNNASFQYRNTGLLYSNLGFQYSKVGLLYSKIKLLPSNTSFHTSKVILLPSNYVLSYLYFHFVITQYHLATQIKEWDADPADFQTQINADKSINRLFLLVVVRL